MADDKGKKSYYTQWMRALEELTGGEATLNWPWLPNSKPSITLSFAHTSDDPRTITANCLEAEERLYLLMTAISQDPESRAIWYNIYPQFYKTHATLHASNPFGQRTTFDSLDVPGKDAHGIGSYEYMFYTLVSGQKHARGTYKTAIEFPSLVTLTTFLPLHMVTKWFTRFQELLVEARSLTTPWDEEARLSYYNDGDYLLNKSAVMHPETYTKRRYFLAAHEDTADNARTDEEKQHAKRPRLYEYLEYFFARAIYEAQQESKGIDVSQRKPDVWENNLAQLRERQQQEQHR